MHYIQNPIYVVYNPKKVKIIGKREDKPAMYSLARFFTRASDSQIVKEFFKLGEKKSLEGKSD